MTLIFRILQLPLISFTWPNYLLKNTFSMTAVYITVFCSPNMYLVPPKKFKITAK